MTIFVKENGIQATDKEKIHCFKYSIQHKRFVDRDLTGIVDRQYPSSKRKIHCFKYSIQYTLYHSIMYDVLLKYSIQHCTGTICTIEWCK